MPSNTHPAKETNLAILTTSENAISESFIQAHRRLEYSKLSYFYGGTIPAYLEGYTPGILGKLLHACCKAIGFYKKDPFYAQSALLRYHLKRLNVNVVLAEYGLTGADCLNTIKKMGIPLIVHFHGYDVSRHLVLDKYKDVYHRLFDYASALVVVSHQMSKKLQSLGAPPKNIIYNPYGPDPSFFDISPSFESQIILSVGRLVDKKAPYHTILAFNEVLKKYPQAKLKVVGDGYLLNICINLTRHLNISENVDFLGSKSKDQIKELMHDCCMFVQHSVTALDGDQEGMPNTILEACAAGLPVVSTRHAGIVDLVIEGETGFLVDEHDVIGMSKHMIEFLDDHSLSKEIGKNGRKRIKNHFSQERHLGQLNSIVSKVINEAEHE
ncbi:MAG: glycosyltransferase [Cyclobacteriaceae bacterium]